MPRRRHALVVVSTAMLPDLGSASKAPDEAGPIVPAARRIDGQDFQLIAPGSYKLVDDIVADRSALAFLPHTEIKGGSVVTLYTGHMVLDLQGHAILVRRDKSAISLSERANRALSKEFGSDEARADGCAVTLRNGTIDLSGNERGNDALSLVDAWTAPGVMTAAHGARSPNGPPAPTDVAYQPTGHVLEKLKVLSRGVSVAVEGTRNVIRDCVIESAGNAAIFSAGPEVLIENCEIRLRPLAAGLGADGSPLRAAIVLRDGANAIIRNNRIRIDTGGLPSLTRCIVVRDGAANVLVENNTFINVEGDTVTAMDGARVVSRGNKTERRTWPW